MLVTVIILFLAAFLFVQGKIRSDLIGLCALLALILFGVLTPTEALAGFSSPIVIMIVGVFIVGGAVFRTGLAKIISKKLLALAGDNQTLLFILIMAVTAGIGAFVSNTGTVAVMLPIVVSLTSAAGTNPSRYLMPLAFASTMGGMLTLIGTTPNMIINGALIDAGYPALDFFVFAPIGVICVTVGTAAMVFLSKLFLDKKNTDDEGGGNTPLSLQALAHKYHLEENVSLAKIQPDSPLCGKCLKELNLPLDYGVRIMEIRRKPGGFSLFKRPAEPILPLPDTVLQASDLILFIGMESTLPRFIQDKRLSLIDPKDGNSGLTPHFEHRFDTVGIAELVVLSTSHLINRQVKDSEVRERFGVNIIGIQRRDQSLLQNIKDEVIQAGDALLVQGGWHAIGRLDAEHSEWVVVGRPFDAASSEPLEHKAPLAALIVLLMIISMVSNMLAPVVAVMLASLCLIFTGCFRNAEEAYKTINWESTVLVASMLPISVALEKTGAASLASNYLIHAVGNLGPYALLAVIYAVTSVVTLFLSNTATAAMCVPVAIQAAVNMHLSPYPFLFAVATAASMSLASPFSTPPNVLVMSPGRYVFMDYVKMGIPLQVLLGIIMVFVLPLLFPFQQ